ncbi:ATP-binding protein [Pseudomonas sp. WS 5410]|uniref:ATP-binding protein n=1 Tax=Pseudomonas shahriarae TaxID=2745512 RepID=UPI001474F214|nr:ATP-binding protein [Pseudomonas sp. WS 5410]
MIGRELPIAAVGDRQSSAKSGRSTRASFRFQRPLDASLAKELTDLEFTTTAQSIVFIGAQGTFKIHRASALTVS